MPPVTPSVALETLTAITTAITATALAASLIPVASRGGRTAHRGVGPRLGAMTVPATTDVAIATGARGLCPRIAFVAALSSFRTVFGGE
jgi:hypothetical protein